MNQKFEIGCAGDTDVYLLHAPIQDTNFLLEKENDT